MTAQADGWSFIATDPVVADLQGKRFANPAEAERIAGLVLDRARLVPATLPVLRQPSGLRLVPQEDA